MSRNHAPVHQDEHLLAFLGVLWPQARQRKRSDCPPDAELAALFDGVLPSARAEAVRAHLLDCPDCYRSLVHLSEVSDIIDGRRHHTSTSQVPRRAWMGAIAAAASLVLAVGVLLSPGDEPWQEELADPYRAVSEAVRSGDYHPPQSGWIWRPGYGSRALGPMPSDVDVTARTAFTVGVAEGLETITSPLDDWLELRSDLALVRTRCEALNSQECAAISELYTHIGRWATLMHFACEPLNAESAAPSGPAFTTDQFWQRNASYLQQIAERAEQPPRAEGYTRLFSNWLSRLDAGDPASLCRGVPPLLSTMDR